MKKVLVIGGRGFIGKNVTEYLSEMGYSVGTYDMFPPEKATAEAYVGDIIHDESFADTLKQYESIVYLVSAIMPKQSMDEPTSSYLTDIPLLLKTLSTCLEVGIKRIVYASSGGTIYGHKDKAAKETDLLCPINHYAICKISCEKILMLYNDIYGMENVVLRISNPYGKYQRIASGVGALNAFTKKTLSKEDIEIWGDGENVRDYVDVRFVASAFEKALQWTKDAEVLPVFNIGSGKGVSLNRLIEIISEETGITPTVKYYEKRSFDIKCNVLDLEKSCRVLGYEKDIDSEAYIRKYIREQAKVFLSGQ